MHQQSWWGELAANPERPGWFRVAAMAYASHRKNGHAMFQPGELAYALATVDRDGVCYPNWNVGRDIKGAIKAGLLSPGSGVRCLVVPAHGVAGGTFGYDDETCQWCAGKRSRQRDRALVSHTE